MNSSRTALVVDDEEPLLRLRVRVLEKAGHQTCTALDVPSALEVFRAQVAEIDLVLLDVQLPPGGGAEDLLPEMWAAKPILRVILTSGDSLPETLEHELQRIGGDFLREPFAPKALLRLVDGQAFVDRSATGAAGHGFSGPGAV